MVIAQHPVRNGGGHSIPKCFQPGTREQPNFTSRVAGSETGRNTH